MMLRLSALRGVAHRPGSRRQRSSAWAGTVLVMDGRGQARHGRGPGWLWTCQVKLGIAGGAGWSGTCQIKHGPDDLAAPVWRPAAPGAQRGHDPQSAAGHGIVVVVTPHRPVRAGI